MRLTITLPNAARLDFDDDDRAEFADMGPAWAEGVTTTVPAVDAHRTMWGEPGAPAGTPRTAPLDCLVTAQQIAYRLQGEPDVFGNPPMPGAGPLVAYAYFMPARDGYEAGYWTMTNPDDAGTAYGNATEAHARIRSVWTGPVRVFSTYEGAEYAT